MIDVFLGGSPPCAHLCKLEFQSLKYTFYCRVNVRHIREEDGRWVVGCAIDPYIPDVLIDYLAEVSGKERRQHTRVKTNTVARIVRAGSARRATRVEGRRWRARGRR